MWTFMSSSSIFLFTHSLFLFTPYSFSLFAPYSTWPKIISNYCVQLLQCQEEEKDSFVTI